MKTAQKFQIKIIKVTRFGFLRSHWLVRKASFVGKVDINEYKCIFVVQVVRCISSNHYVQVKSIIPSQYIATMMAGDSWKKSKGHKPSLHFWDFISNEIYLIPWKRANCHCIQEKLAWMIRWFHVIIHTI